MFWAVGVLLTNAYIIYLTHNLSLGKKKNNLLSHHDFLRDIAIAWITEEDVVKRTTKIRKQERENGDTETTASPARRSLASSSYLSEITCETVVAVRCKGTPLTTKSLSPEDGYFKVRLNTQQDHLPEDISGRVRCALHRWAGKDVWSRIAYCPTCNVSLCMECYKKFHTISDLVRLEKSIKNS